MLLQGFNHLTGCSFRLIVVGRYLSQGGNALVFAIFFVAIMETGLSQDAWVSICWLL
jgi:hypothetical protein